MHLPETGYRLRQIAVFAASMVLLAFLVYTANISRIIAAITSIRPMYFFTALILANTPIMLYSYSWFLVFSSKGFSITLIEALKLKLSSLFISNSTPFGDAGGEPFIAYKISKDREKDYLDVLSTIAITDFINLLPFYFIAAISAATFLLTNEIGFYLSAAVSVLTFSIITALVCWKRFWILKVAEILMIKIKSYLRFGSGEKIREKIRNIIENYSLTKPDLAKIISAGILAFLLDISSFLVLSAGMQFEFNILVLIFIITVSRTANLAPSIGGAGVYELTLTGLLVSLTSLSLADAVSLAILYRGITFYFGTFIGFIALNRN